MRKAKQFILIVLSLIGLFAVAESQSTKPVLFKLKDIRDVSKTLPTDGQILVYVASTKFWTPATASGTGDMLESTWAGSGKILAAKGGTGIDSSALSGLALLTAGTWSTTVTPSITSLSTSGVVAAGTNVTAGGTVTATGAIKGANAVLEGGTYDTTLSPGTPSASVTYVLPAADGSALQVLQTDGSHNLSWATMPSLGSGTINYVAYWSSGSEISAEPYLAVSRGGTGISTTGLTGFPTIAGGVWSVSGALSDAYVDDNITLTNITQVTNRSHTNLTSIGTNTHAQVDTHIASTSNPHSVTKAQVGLTSVEDTALSTWAGTSNITTVGTIASGTWSGTALVDAKVADDITLTNITQITNRSHTNLTSIGTNTHAQVDSHIASTSNPHSVTKAQVGLTSVEDTALSTWVGTTNVTTLGTIATGTWAAGAVTSSGGLKGTSLVFEGGTYDTTFQAGTPSASKTYTLPLTDGSNGQALTTNGSAVLSWTTVAGAGDMLQATYDADADNKINQAAGGTDIDTSASTGTPQISAGTWSVLGTVIADTAANTFTVTKGTTDLVVSADSTINQNLAIAASPTFAGLTVGSSTGIAKVTSGVLGASASTITDGTNTWTIANGTSSLAVSGGAALTINQSVSTSSSPSFAGATISANSATITHSGTTNLTLASTSGTVTVEGVVFNGTNITTGGWQGTVVGAIYGGTGANTSAMTGYPYMTSGVVAQDTTFTHTTNGATITGALSDSVSITHDGTNATISTTDGEIILDSSEAAAVAQVALSDDDTNYVVISAQEMAADWTMTLPAADGSAGSLLVDSNGSGTLAFLGTTVADTAANTFTVTKGTTDLIVSTDVTLNQNLSSSSSPTFATVILEGGTYDTTLSAGTPAASWTATFPTTAGSNGQVLTTNGTGTLSWTSAGAGDMTKAVYDTDANNIVDVENGGTGVATFALNGVLYGNAGNAVGVTAIGAEGQILRVGASPFVPAWTTATFPATAGNAGNVLVSDGTNWSSANVLSAVPTGLTYTTATRALSLTTDYFIPSTSWAGQAAITTVGTLSAGNATAVVDAASITAAGKIEIAIASEVNTGTDATRAVSPDSLAGSVFGTKTMILKVMAEATVVTSGDGKMYVTIPAEFNGMNLVSIGAHVYTADNAQNMDIDLYNFTDSQDMLSTAMRIETNENDTITSAQPGAINATYDDVVTGDVIRIDVTTFTGVVGAGLEIRLGFSLP